METKGTTERDLALAETYLALQQRKVDQDIVSTVGKTNTLLGWIIFILLMPYVQYMSDRQFSKFYCDRYDMELTTKLECALKSKIATGVTFSADQVTMCLRGSLKGLWSLMFFGIGTNRGLVPRAIQYMCISKAPYKDSTLSESFADPDTAADMINKLLYNSQNTGQTVSVFEMVCQALEMSDSVCDPKEADACDNSLVEGAVEGATSGVMNGFMIMEGMMSMGKSGKAGLLGAVVGMGATIGLSVGASALRDC